MMSKYRGKGLEPAIILMATLLALIVVFVVAAPATHRLYRRMDGGSWPNEWFEMTNFNLLNNTQLFIDIQCNGVFDNTTFHVMNMVCEDCAFLFRKSKLRDLCRENCFTSDFFEACLEVLLIDDNMEKRRQDIAKLNGYIYVTVGN